MFGGQVCRHDAKRWQISNKHGLIHWTVPSLSVGTQRLIGSWSFTSWQHLRSYQDGYRFTLYSAAPTQVTGTMTQRLTQLHYPDTELS